MQTPTTFPHPASGNFHDQHLPVLEHNESRTRPLRKYEKLLDAPLSACARAADDEASLSGCSNDLFYFEARLINLLFQLGSGYRH